MACNLMEKTSSLLFIVTFEGGVWIATFLVDTTNLTLQPSPLRSLCIGDIYTSCCTAPTLSADNPLLASGLSDVYLHTSSFQGGKQGINGTGNENLTMNQSPLGAWLCLDLSITPSWTIML